MDLSGTHGPSPAAAAAATGTEDSSASGDSSSAPRERITEHSIKFSNSRTLPGQ
ncbi:MAG TPA: hypothetical protein VGK82_01515 [Pyrinomonadaceae bacterium]